MERDNTVFEELKSSGHLPTPAGVGRLALASVFSEEYPEIVVESLVHPSLDIKKLEQERFDIDHFKSVNDVWGHDIGDVVLKEAAMVFKESIRDNDEICRIGGEEFLLIAKKTSEKQSLVPAERVRIAMQERIIPVEGWDRELTVSIGIASFDPSVESIEDLLKRSDEALYAAKDNGRNRYYHQSELKDLRKAG